MEICIGLFIVFWVLGIIFQIAEWVKHGTPSPTQYTTPDFDEEDPYQSETLLAILEDDCDIIDWTGNGPGL